MEMESLRIQFEAASRTDKFDVHNAFVKALLSSNDRDVMAYHYELLRNRENRDLYLDLRAAYTKRGDEGAQYLVEKVENESDFAMRADLLLMLGVMRNKTALKLAHEALTSEDSDLRHRGCCVFGWMGDKQDINSIGKLLMGDPDPHVRGTAATAHRQFYYRLPEAKDLLLMNLKKALAVEQDKEVVAWIVITVQSIMKKRFGLREDIEEGEITGDTEAAKKKCLQALNPKTGLGGRI